MEDRAGGIWVASEYSGLSRISVLNEGTSRIYPESRELFDRSNTIRMLTKMSNGDIWVGTRKGGLYTFDANLQSKMTNQYFHSNIYAIAEDRQGRMWTGTRGNGLKVGDTWYYNTPSDPTSLSDNNVLLFIAIAKTVCGWVHSAEGSNWLNLLLTGNINSGISSSKRSE